MCTRWLVVDDYGRSDGHRRDIELVVSDEEDNVSIRGSRRHVFDDLKIVNNNIVEGNDQCSLRLMSICVPPKNALLLMRCRSDPLELKALANRLWDSTISQNDDSYQDNDELVQNDFEYVHEIQEIQQMKHNIKEKNLCSSLALDRGRKKVEDEIGSLETKLNYVSDQEI
ncbi:hypothetical protein Tco_1136173 [Tanacetum coccineum]